MFAVFLWYEQTAAPTASSFSVVCTFKHHLHGLKCLSAPSNKRLAVHQIIQHFLSEWRLGAPPGMCVPLFRQNAGISEVYNLSCHTGVHLLSLLLLNVRKREHLSCTSSLHWSNWKCLADIWTSRENLSALLFCSPGLQHQLRWINFRVYAFNFNLKSAERAWGLEIGILL